VAWLLALRPPHISVPQHLVVALELVEVAPVPADSVGFFAAPQQVSGLMGPGDRRVSGHHFVEHLQGQLRAVSVSLVESVGALRQRGPGLVESVVRQWGPSVERERALHHQEGLGHRFAVDLQAAGRLQAKFFLVDPWAAA
jgi:hypothetical protein